MVGRPLVLYALLVVAATALFAAMFLLGPLGAEPLQKRMPPAPMIVVAARMAAEPGGRMPLLIEVGPPQWVPDDSTLIVQGLPPTAHLSEGQRLSADLWSVPVAALSRLTLAATANAVGRWNLRLKLVGGEGNLLAEATTTISISAPAVTAAEAAGRPPPPDASGVAVENPAVPPTSAVEPVQIQEGRENPTVAQGVAHRAEAPSEAALEPIKTSRQPADASSHRRASREMCGSRAQHVPRKAHRNGCRHGRRAPKAGAEADVMPAQNAGPRPAPEPAQGASPGAARGAAQGSAAELASEQASRPADAASRQAPSPAPATASAAPPELLASAPGTAFGLASRFGSRSMPGPAPAPGAEAESRSAATSPQPRAAPGARQAAEQESQRSHERIPPASAISAALVEGAVIRPSHGPLTVAGPEASPASGASEARTASDTTSPQASSEPTESVKRKRELAPGETAVLAALATPAARSADDPSLLSTPGQQEPDRTVVAARPDDAERLVARGEAQLASGNIAIARQFFLRAAERGSARGALLLAATYDPHELDLPEFVGVLPDRALAVSWYRRAQELGAALAAKRLARLNANAP